VIYQPKHIYIYIYIYIYTYYIKDANARFWAYVSE